MDNNATTIWDPIQRTLSKQSYDIEQKLFLDKVEKYRKNPYLFKLYLVLCVILAAVALITFAIHPYDFRVLGACFIPLLIYGQYVAHMQEEVILYLLCEKNNWLYNPVKDYTRPTSFTDLMPDIFNYGHDQNFEEQIWGSINYSKGFAPFWNAQFSYTTGSGRSSHTTTEHIFILKLRKPLAINFSLVKAGLLGKFEEQIKTESENFNNTLRIIVSDNDTTTKMEVIKILSPSVQTRLIDFCKTYNSQKITFQNDMMVIVFKDDLWKTKYTNFFKKVSIDSRDEERFNDALVHMAELPTEMLQFID